MERHIGRIWLASLVVALAVVVLSLGEPLKPIATKPGEVPFLIALTRSGILYIVALFVERSLEMLIKAWRPCGESHLESEERSAEMSTASAIGPTSPTARGVFERTGVESDGFLKCLQQRRGPKPFAHRMLAAASRPETIRPPDHERPSQHAERKQLQCEATKWI